MLEKLPDAIGRVLVDQRAGLENIVFHRLGVPLGHVITVQSVAFADYGVIPAIYTADLEGVSPPISWSGIPAGASRLVLIVEDADAPTPHPLVHAIVVNLPATDGSLSEGALASPDHAGLPLTLGLNSYLQQAWLPPDPPPGHGLHRYAFQVFALRGGTDIGRGVGRDDLVEAIRKEGLASGCLIGTYERPSASSDDDTAPQQALTGLN